MHTEKAWVGCILGSQGCRAILTPVPFVYTIDQLRTCNSLRCYDAALCRFHSRRKIFISGKSSVCAAWTFLLIPELTCHAFAADASGLRICQRKIRAAYSTRCQLLFLGLLACYAFHHQP